MGKTRAKPRISVGSGLPDIALGAAEAAAVMGVHWTQAGVMARKGLLTVRVLAPAAKTAGIRDVAIYSLAEAEADYQEYLETKEAGKGGRPRVHLDEREAVLRHLRTLKHQITFGDACGVAEAAGIMGVHWTFPPKMARAGTIVGRVLRSGRPDSSGDRLWVFSRSSCAANAATAKRLQTAGKKIGRPRRAFA